MQRPLSWKSRDAARARGAGLARRGRWLAAAGAALALLLSAAAPAQAVITIPNISPSSGTTRGGTVVTVPIPTGASFSQVSAGYHFTVALDINGYAWAWGDNSQGQLGIESYTDSSIPVPVWSGLRFKDIAAGYDHVIAIDEYGTLYAWGDGSYGKLGNDDNSDQTRPVRVSSSLTFKQVSAGSDHSLAITTDGKAYAWGYNSNGELGVGDYSNRYKPTAVNTSQTFKQIVAGGKHSLGLNTSGKAYAWGRNYDGQLGNNDTSDRSSPVAVNGGLTFSSLAAGSYHSMGITTGGVSYAWGDNYWGQLGDTTDTDRLVPKKITMPSGVTFTQLAASHYSSYGLNSSGKAYSWGNNKYSQLGRTTSSDWNATPAAVNTTVNFTQIAGSHTNNSDSRGGHAIGINSSSGRAYGWGDNDDGQIGDGTTTERATPKIATARTTAATKITFSDTAGTSLSNPSAGKAQVTTPPVPVQDAGTWTVYVYWTIDGIAQPVLSPRPKFTFVAPPPPQASISTVAYSDAGYNTVIPKNTVLAPGTRVYWQYTVKNTGTVPFSIRELKRAGGALSPSAVCGTIELAANATTTCRASSTV